jgi:hypothetical protein
MNDNVEESEKEYDDYYEGYFLYDDILTHYGIESLDLQEDEN